MNTQTAGDDYATSLAESIAEHAVLWGEDDEGNDVPMGFDVNALRTLVDAAIKGSVNRALAEAADAIEAGVLPSHPNDGYRDGFARCASIVRALIPPVSASQSAP